jgi:hypothetical protein
VQRASQRFPLVSWLAVVTFEFASRKTSWSHYTKVRTRPSRGARVAHPSHLDSRPAARFNPVPCAAEAEPLIMNLLLVDLAGPEAGLRAVGEADRGTCLTTDQTRSGEPCSLSMTAPRPLR